MAITIVPYINPIEFYEKGFTPQAQYNSKHINDYKFADTIYAWQQPTTFRQIWQLNDSIRLQFRSETGPITWKLYDLNGVQIDTDNFDQVLENADNPGEFIYQADIDLSGYSAGCYYFEVELGSPVEKTLVSETLEFSNLFENSVLLQYSHSSFREDVIFETDIVFTIRLNARLFYKAPASKDVIYEDQVLNETIVDSKSYDLWELQLSDERGIPDWLIRKLNGILGCDDLVIDGRNFTKSEGAKLEETNIDDYPMRGWKIELREQLNRRARYFSTTGSADQGYAVVVNTDSKGFTDDETGGSEFQILDIQ
jgi:hypothetical protein